MKNKCQFPRVLTLLLLFLLFSPSTQAQLSRNPETDLSVTYQTQNRTLYVDVERKSANLYECVRVEFDLYSRPAPGQQKKHLGVFPVEAPMREYAKYHTWGVLPYEADVSKKSITDCWASAASQKVTVYEETEFKGREKSFGVGTYTLTDVNDFNDSISSIKVPTGLVAIVYEDADAGGGYGRYVDFLENQRDLKNYDFAKKISYLKIFPSGRQWVRNERLSDGSVKAGYSIGGRRWAPPNANPVVAPPKPPNIRTPPPVVFCSVTGLVKNYRTIYGSVFTLTLYRDGIKTEMKTTVSGAQYTIPNVPAGDYELRSAGYYEPNKHSIFVDGGDGSSKVTCRNGRANSVNFKIDSGD